jgi:purine-binding chemotaxis protein CheW
MVEGDRPAGEERRRILAERRAALAAVPPDAARETWPVIAFRIADGRYAVPAASARQFVEARRLSPLGGAPPWMLGAVQARAQVVPVLDLRRLLGRTGSALRDATCVILLEDDGDVFGVAVDAVEGRLELPRDALTEAEGGLVRWWGPESLGVLDVARLGLDGAAADQERPR